MGDAPATTGDRRERVYIHELIDVIGLQRARYMHHMTAHWCPEAREQRAQLCYGVWGVLGSTGRWPQVVNLWEYPGGWDSLAASFDLEVSGPTMQDPMLAQWWHAAVRLRRGGEDRLLVAEPWARDIETVCADGVRGVAYAHELVTVPPGSSGDLLRALVDEGRGAAEALGLVLLGGFDVAMRNGTECLFLWAIPDWATWARFEREWQDGESLRAWRRTLVEADAMLERILLVDSPLNPMRTGRQPRREDRRPLDDFFPPLD